MHKEEIENLLRQIMRSWPLYTEQDHVRAYELSDGWSIDYCGVFAGVPFTAGMRMAYDPPHLLQMNICGDVLYLLFIQVAPADRGKGFGEALYECVVEFARQLGLREVRQTPSGGWEGQSREAYLIKRGWTTDNREVFKLVGK